MLRPHVYICEVTAAISGGQELFAHPGLTLQHIHLNAASGKGAGSHKARRAAADHSTFHSTIPSSLIICSPPSSATPWSAREQEV